MIYNVIRTWLFIKRKLKNRKLFREIRFDETANKTSKLRAKILETHHVKDMISIANAKHEFVLGLYRLCALRPSLIPMLRVKHIRPRSITWKNEHIELVKPCLVIVPKEHDDGRPVTGNKANIEFPIFIPSIITEKIEMILNQGTVTPETKLTCADNARDVERIVRKYYAMIGFDGKPYRLRNYGDYLLDRITRRYHDEDFKEFLMGHKGKISAIYQNTGLTREQEAQYREMYVTEVDAWINEHIYGHASKGQLEQAEMIKRFAVSLGVPENTVEEIYALMQKGRMSISLFQDRLASITRKFQQDQMRDMVKQVVDERLKLALPEMDENSDSKERL